jgi:hypothetical protein
MTSLIGSTGRVPHGRPSGSSLLEPTTQVAASFSMDPLSIIASAASVYALTLHLLSNVQKLASTLKTRSTVLAAITRDLQALQSVLQQLEESEAPPNGPKNQHENAFSNLLRDAPGCCVNSTSSSNLSRHSSQHPTNSLSCWPE